MRRFVILALCALAVFFVALSFYNHQHRAAPRPVSIPAAFMATARAVETPVTFASFSLDNAPVRYNVYDSSGASGLRGMAALAAVVGDSVRVVVQWAHPADSLGTEDSTTFRIKSSRTIRFMGGGSVTPDTWRRRSWKATTTADTFKVLAPLAGDSVLFQADSIQQWRKGAGSVPGSAGWKYNRSAAPASMTFTRTTTELF